MVFCQIKKVFKNREESAEARAAREHDKQLLEKLKAKLRSEQGADNKNHVEVIEKLQSAIHDIKLPEKVVQQAKGEPLTAEDFLTLRKELMNKVRDLEDELAKLRLTNKQ